MDVENPLTILGQTLYRNQSQRFGIRLFDRRYHIYLIGKTGVGKTSLLESLSHQDILAGHGLCVIDPHGQLVERLREIAQVLRPDKLLYFDVASSVDLFGFNPLSYIAPDKHSLAVSGILDVFQHLWPDFMGPRTEHLLRHCLFSLLELPFTTLMDVLRLLEEPIFRKNALPYLSPHLQRFWNQEYEKYSVRHRTESIAPIQNKLGAFFADPRLRAILSQPTSSFHLRQVMDEGNLLLVNLAKGKIGHDAATLLGALLVSQLSLAGLSRADIPEVERRDFYVYLDEFQNFATESITVMLAELRKYRVSLVMANQFLAQLPMKVREGILGTVGTLISFRVGPSDAEILAKELAPVFRE